jgi:hypothetical protein
MILYLRYFGGHHGVLESGIDEDEPKFTVHAQRWIVAEEGDSLIRKLIKGAFLSDSSILSLGGFSAVALLRAC